MALWRATGVIEIQQQARWIAAGLQAGDHLRDVDGMQALDCLTSRTNECSTMMSRRSRDREPFVSLMSPSRT
jgi:hypothetical protein